MYRRTECAWELYFKFAAQGIAGRWTFRLGRKAICEPLGVEWGFEPPQSEVHIVLRRGRPCLKSVCLRNCAGTLKHSLGFKCALFAHFVFAPKDGDVNPTRVGDSKLRKYETRLSLANLASPLLGRHETIPGPRVQFQKKLLVYRGRSS